MKNQFDKHTNDCIRILKELGLWHIWKKYRNNYTPDRLNNLIGESFGEFINQSFVWHKTDYEDLWIRLFNFSGYRNTKNILKGETSISMLKDLVNKEIKML